MSGNYKDIEASIRDACEKLFEADRPNVAARVQEFQILEAYLRASYHRCQSKSECSTSNK
ncbi:hypothetical protein L873DRAFT_1819800 [Choiromyces venosus 120613-1]|uniref:Uncharacterized protein n=1 Tax=Choiromyces venosus 120613-1 TaxID=1336337 RepID=A0A3N4IZC2_9PEZI|nr:hypothetical protein L873DRAFT_1819800 [Choiromyces venosus 120613-1]